MTAASGPLTPEPAVSSGTSPIDASGHTIPITYLGKDGKQYVAIMAGGGGGYFGGEPADTLIAYALGDGAAPDSIITDARTQAAPAQVNLPDTPSKTVLERTCGTTCHGLETVTAVRRDRASWASMLDTMVARGATATPEELKLILDYLSQYATK